MTSSITSRAMVIFTSCIVANLELDNHTFANKYLSHQNAPRNSNIAARIEIHTVIDLLNMRELEIIVELLFFDLVNIHSSAQFETIL